MPGRSGRLQRVGLLFFAVALVGYAVLGWRFGDGSTDPAAFGLALVAVGVAAYSTLRSRG
ncbi:hypothetical protein [Halobacterium yunchengense]|uniref:hypothetical protein n=1 Tax=Halobacterium yunchengense TaxID=3108497 RepID=UPI00300BB145